MKVPALKILALSSIATFAFADENATQLTNGFEPTFSLGASTFAVAHNIKYNTGFGTAERDMNYGGLQLLGAMNINNHVQASLGLYQVYHEDDTDNTTTGRTLKVNAGTGFKEKGFKFYGTLGYFSETVEEDNFDFDASGFEYGFGIGYNFERVSLDYGFTVRDSSDYEDLDNVTDVKSASGYLALTVNL